MKKVGKEGGRGREERGREGGKKVGRWEVGREGGKEGRRKNHGIFLTISSSESRLV